jgi:hypothetical protein
MGNVVDISYALKTRRYASRRRLDARAVHRPPTDADGANASSLRRQSSEMAGQHRRADETCLCEGCPAIVREGKYGWFWFDMAGRPRIHCTECWLKGRGE